MQKYLNYEDNIFILNTRIRMIGDLLLLEADPVLFLDKTVEDLDFVDYTANALLKSLLQNTHLIDWDEQLHNLFDTEERFYSLLKSIMNGQAVFSGEKYPIIDEIVKILAADSIERKKMIKENMKDSTNTGSASGMVSVEELNLLVGNEK
ncbi:MAG: hypothetical protein LBV68_04985 [Spirochaetaceae bacterium]|jgi:hypothetical protein|nr:hypothetical protein [Spirochaetaceae bacterium]